MNCKQLPIITGLVLLAAGLFSAPSAQEESVQLPDLRIVGWRIDDAVNGNGDAGLHPGERARLYVTLSNQGNEPARDVQGLLSETVDHPDVTIVDKSARWNDLPATGVPGEAFSSFEIEVATTRPCRWRIPLTIELTAQDGYVATRNIELELVDPARVDLLPQTARPFIYGRDSGDGSNDVATGDFDGDGYDDLLLGVTFGDGPANARADAGEVVVVYGQAGGLPDIDLTAPPAGVAFIYGVDAGDRLGARVAAGDLNGDGYDDLILGAIEGDGPANADFNKGEVVVVYGRAAQLTDIDLATPPLDPEIVFIWGADVGDQLSRVATGDLDGDGYDDLLLGAVVADGPGGTRGNAGEVVVIYGDTAHLTDVDLATSPAIATFIYGADAGDGLGTDVAAGDFDGDGYDDLLAGGTGGDGPAGNRSSAGHAVVVYGGPVRLSDVDMATPPAHAGVIHGADAFDQFGIYVGSGDLDGDGSDEILASASFGDGPGNDVSRAGEVVAIYGSPQRVTEIDLADPPDDAAWVYGIDDLSAIAAGDVDGDGYDDLVLGGPNASRGATSFVGIVALIPGGPQRGISIDLASAPPGVTLLQTFDEEDELGRIVAVGDVDGDGYDDMILPVPGGDGPDGVIDGRGEVAIVPGAPRARYRWDADSFAFIDATTGTNLGLACDDCSATVPIGFDFDFFGETKTEVTISSNGYLTFGGPGHYPEAECPLRSSAPNDVIAVFWQDLDPSQGGAVYTLLEGTAPNRRLTVEWSQVPHYFFGDAGTFEVTLFESSNQILLQYQDTTFGDLAVDDGLQAVAHVENRTGATSMPLSQCDNDNLTAGSAYRLRRFAAPTLHYAEDFEASDGGYTGAGQWNYAPGWAFPACGESRRSGAAAWFYGSSIDCEYTEEPGDAGLVSPVVTGLPQDAALSFWHRKGIVIPGDITRVHVSGNAGPFDVLRNISENSQQWRHSDDFQSVDGEARMFSPLDLSGYIGQDVQLEFRFTNNDNTGFGWLIDDVEIRGCPVFGAGGAGGGGAASEARATAQTPLYCEGGAGRVDALGSYCAACPALSYQWSKDDSPVPGATGVAYDIPGTELPGTFGYTVAIACASGGSVCDDTSNVAGVEIVQAPQEVGPTLTVDRVNGGAELEFHWTDVAGAESYALFSDSVASGAFATEEATSGSGAPGVVIPLPVENLVFYLVGGRNPTCGDGPL